MSEMQVKSPFASGRTVNASYSSGQICAYHLEHRELGFDDAAVTENTFHLLSEGTYRTQKEEFLEEDTQAALALARTYLWKNLRSGQKSRYVLTSASTKERAMEAFAPWAGGRPAIVQTVEELVAEAKALTFLDRAVKTLESVDAWSRQFPESYFMLPYAEKSSAGNFSFRSVEGDFENGMCFGSDERLAPAIYRFLLEEGYIGVHKVAGQSSGFVVTGKGYTTLDQARKGSGALSRTVFLVVRFDPELEGFLNPVLAEVNAALKCTIAPVWGAEHIERIDERIFRTLRESAVVVVDVSPDRFNVGLELGYALALGKPVVLIREKPRDEDPDWSKRLPFDIQTLNCFDYERDKRQELVEKLVARVGLALELQKLK